MFTSQNAVDAVFDRLALKKMDARAFAGTLVAAVGNQTADAVKRHGIIADLIPGGQTSADLTNAFESLELNLPGLTGATVLFPCSQIASDIVPEDLRSLGAKVDRIAVYKTARPKFSRELVAEALTNALDMITFTSSSTATNMAEILDETGHGHMLGRIPTACIGPSTAQTAREAGFHVALEASPPSIEALVRSIEDYFEHEESP